MTGNNATIAMMVIYMAVCLGLGFVAWRRTHTLGILFSAAAASAVG